MRVFFKTVFLAGHSTLLLEHRERLDLSKVEALAAGDPGSPLAYRAFST